VCSQDGLPKSIFLTSHSGDKTLQSDCSLFEEIVLARPSGNHSMGVLRRSTLLKTAMSKLYPRIAALLWALLQQVDGSPALQSLVLCLYFIASGMATNQVKMFYARVSDILLARGSPYHRLPSTAGRH
jgi:hypothetical protein